VYAGKIGTGREREREREKINEMQK